MVSWATIQYQYQGRLIKGRCLCMFWFDQIAGYTTFCFIFLQGREIKNLSALNTFFIDLVHFRIPWVFCSHFADCTELIPILYFSLNLQGLINYKIFSSLNLKKIIIIVSIFLSHSNKFHLMLKCFERKLLFLLCSLVILYK